MKRYWISEEQLLELQTRFFDGDEETFIDMFTDKVRSQPLPDEPSVEVEKCVWGCVSSRTFEFRGKNYHALDAMRMVLKELADAKAEMQKLKRTDTPQPDREESRMVCSGCGKTWGHCSIPDGDYWIKKTHYLSRDIVCGHAIPKSEFKGEKK